MEPVLITGAASGIGRATAQAVAWTGRDVLIMDLDADGLAETAERCGAADVAVHTEVLDVTDDEARAAALAGGVAALGPMTGLVHAAGISGPEPISSFTSAAWRTLMSINLEAAAALTHELHPMMRDAGGGSIVYLSSMQGHVGNPLIPAYCASKSALLGLARSAAAELGIDGIRVNCVCPGAVDTPMLAPVVAFPEWREDILRRTPLGRLAQPEEIADAIVFLLGDQSRFITGTSLTVDGGMTAIGGL